MCFFWQHSWAVGNQGAFTLGFFALLRTAGPQSLCLRGGGDGAEGDWHNDYTDQPPPPPSVYGQYGSATGAGYDAYQNYGQSYGQYGDDKEENEGYGAYRGDGGDWRGRYARGRAWGRARGRGRFHSRGAGGGGSAWADNGDGAEVLYGGYGSSYKGMGGRGRFRSRGWAGRGREGYGNYRSLDAAGRYGNPNYALGGGVVHEYSANLQNGPEADAMGSTWGGSVPAASQGGAMGMLSMLQEDAASSDGRWGYGGQAGGGGHGQQGLTGRDRRASVGSGMKHIGDRTWRQGGNSHGFAGVGEGDEGERGGTQQGPANGGGPAKRRGGDVSSPQTLKKSLFASHEGSGNEKRGSDQIEAGMTGSNTGLDGAGELSPRRASFPGGAGASAEPRDASRSAPEPPRPEDPFVTWERTRTLLANRDPDTVEIITEAEAREREHYRLEDLYAEQMPHLLVKLSLQQQRRIAESNPQKHRQLSPQAADLMSMSSNVLETMFKYEDLHADTPGKQRRVNRDEGGMGSEGAWKGAAVGRGAGDGGVGVEGERKAAGEKEMAAGGSSWLDGLSSEEIDFSDGRRFFDPHEPLERQVGKEAMAYWERHKWDEYRSPLYDAPHLVGNSTWRREMEEGMQRELMVLQKMLLYKTLPERGRPGEYVDGELQIDADVMHGIVEALDPGGAEPDGGSEADESRLAKLLDDGSAPHPAPSTASGAVASNNVSAADAQSEHSAPHDQGGALSQATTAEGVIEGAPGKGGSRGQAPRDADGFRYVREREPAAQSSFSAADSKLNRLYLRALAHEPGWAEVLSAMERDGLRRDDKSSRHGSEATRFEEETQVQSWDDEVRVASLLEVLERDGKAALDEDAEEADVSCDELTCKMHDLFSDETEGVNLFRDPTESLNRQWNFWDQEPTEIWRNPSPPVPHHPSTPNGPLPALRPDSTPAGGANATADGPASSSDPVVLAALSQPTRSRERGWSAEIGGSGAGAGGSGDGGRGPAAGSVAQQLAQESKQADNLRLVSIAQRLGIQLKYSEPPERGIPHKKWVLKEYEGGVCLRAIDLSSASYFLLGRDQTLEQLLGRNLIVLPEQTVSGQHAVLQFRTTAESSSHMVILREGLAETDDDADGNPYIIDLSSTNGSFLNGERVEAGVFYRLKEADSLRFAYGEREYRLLLQPARVSI